MQTLYGLLSPVTCLTVVQTVSSVGSLVRLGGGPCLTVWSSCGGGVPWIKHLHSDFSPSKSGTVNTWIVKLNICTALLKSGRKVVKLKI